MPFTYKMEYTVNLIVFLNTNGWKKINKLKKKNTNGWQSKNLTNLDHFPSNFFVVEIK